MPEKKERLYKKHQEELLAASLHLYKWLKDHPFIKVHSVCEKAGISSSNFYIYSRDKKPQKKYVLDAMIPLLKEYGYQEPAAVFKKEVKSVEIFDEDGKPISATELIKSIETPTVNKKKIPKAAKGESVTITITEENHTKPGFDRAASIRALKSKK